MTPKTLMRRCALLLCTFLLTAGLSSGADDSFFSDASDTFFVSGVGVTQAMAVDEAVLNAGRQWLHAMFGVDGAMIREKKMLAVLLENRADLVLDFQYIGAPIGAESHVTVNALVTLDADTFEGFLEDDEAYAGDMPVQRNIFADADRLLFDFPESYITTIMGEYAYDPERLVAEVPVTFTFDFKQALKTFVALDKGLP